MRSVEKSAKTVDEAIKLALDELKLDIGSVKVSIVDEGSRGILGIGSRPATVLVTEKEVVKEVVDTTTANLFLKELFMNMGLKVEISIKVTEDKMNINLSGDDMGIVIGKRGETLDAIQYLTSLVVNKNKESYIKVVLDTENYRAKREDALKKLAVRLAGKVKATRRKVTLEPMSAAERRIIHAELQNYNGVTTYSIGDAPSRKVVIAPQRPEYQRHDAPRNKQSKE